VLFVSLEDTNPPDVNARARGLMMGNGANRWCAPRSFRRTQTRTHAPTRAGSHMRAHGPTPARTRTHTNSCRYVYMWKWVSVPQGLRRFDECFLYRCRFDQGRSIYRFDKDVYVSIRRGYLYIGSTRMSTYRFDRVDLYIGSTRISMYRFDRADLYIGSTSRSS
jgi:hypothetical protein